MNAKPSQELQEFNCLFKEINGIYHEITLHAGISDSTFHILYCIVEFGDGCLQKDISKQYFMSKQTINSSIKTLKAKGYLTLAKGKGRNMHLHLTPAGQQLMEEKIAPVIDAENSVFSEMSPEETREFLRLTKKYARLLRKNAVQKLLLTFKEKRIK